MKEINKGAKSERIFKLCDNRNNCPVVRISGKEAVITDDFGGEVKITVEQLRQIKKIKI